MTPLSFQEIPTNLRGYELERIEQLRREMQDPTQAYEIDGILHWVSNDAIIPPFVYEDGKIDCPAIQRAAYDKDLAISLDRYCKARQGRVPSAEEQFEMRAAFGPDAEVVNIITGQVWKT